MPHKPKTITFWCKYCDTYETWPEEEYGKTIVAIYCPSCSAKGKIRKMLRVKENVKKM